MNKTCAVSNKSAGILVYNIPELRLRREFAPGETKKNIPVSELEQLIQISGGKTMIEDYLLIHDAEVVQNLLNFDPPIEYWLAPKDIPNWIDTCSLDEFEDAIRFAPEGTKDLIKEAAVSLPLNDFAKRQVIKDNLGFDVTQAVENKKADTPEQKPAVAAAQRKAASSSIKVPTTEEKKITVKKED